MVITEAAKEEHPTIKEISEKQSGRGATLIFFVDEIEVAENTINNEGNCNKEVWGVKFLLNLMRHSVEEIGYTVEAVTTPISWSRR